MAHAMTAMTHCPSPGGLTVDKLSLLTARCTEEREGNMPRALQPMAPYWWLKLLSPAGQGKQTSIAAFHTPSVDGV